MLPWPEIGNEAEAESVHTQVAVDTQIMRGINTSAVLSVLRAQGRMSVSEISERTGLSRQAVSRSLASLETAGFVVFAAPDAGEPRSGRPAQLVQFRADAGHVLGISMSPREVRIALADLSGEVVLRHTAPLDGTAPTIDVLALGVRHVLTAHGIEAADIWAASIATPGIVDPGEGLVRFVPSMSELEGDVLARTIATELGCDLLLDNDLKLATEGEQWLGAPHDVSSLVLIEWGERVGAGVLLNGALYRGASNDAGDLGFLDLGVGADQGPLPRDAHPELGPFESWVGGAQLVALARAAAERSGDRELVDVLQGRSGPDALDAVLSAVQDGAPSAVEAVVEIAHRFASGIAAIRALLDPQLIIIGGPMARSGEVLLGALRDALSSQVLDQPALEISSLGDDAAVYGAIHRALGQVDRTRFAFTTVTGTVAPQARQHHPITQ